MKRTTLFKKMKTTCIAFSFLTVFSASAEVPTHLKIFLIGGQSNAVGLGVNSDLPLEYKGVQTNVKSYTSYKCSDAVNSDKWLHVAPGVCDFSTKHGCELSLAKKLSLLYPNDSIAIIKCALGSTTLATQWRSPSLGGPTDTDPNFHMYQIFMNTVNTALSKLGSAYTYEIAGMVWMQGENDGIQNDWASNYETNLTAFIADLRKDLNTPNMPFSIAKISIVPYWPFATTIRQAEDNVAAKMSNVGIVDANNYPRITSDPYHYTGTGLISMGNEFALSLHSIIQKTPYYILKSVGEATTLNGINNTLQLLVDVIPATASKDVNWSVDEPNIASINPMGLLTAKMNGTVLVTATAKDGSVLHASKIITITGAVQQNY